MANVIMILGKSSTGKTESVKALNPKETAIISVLGKRMLWDKERNYSEENKNLFNISDHRSVASIIQNISEKGTHIKNIVIDDMIYIMTKEYFKRAGESGYGKYTELAQHFQQVIEACEKARADLNIFLILHAEEVYSDKIHVGYKARTIGQLVDSSYNPIEVVPILLFSDIRYNDQGKAEYGFYTERMKIGTVEIPAKSGGLFSNDWIPNDLSLVTDALK